MELEKFWQRYKKYLYYNQELGLTLDISRVDFREGYFSEMEEKIAKAYKAMEELEAGAIANPDENRMVGHYWLRAPHLAPTKKISQEITGVIERIQKFSDAIRQGKILAQGGRPFQHLLIVGIGGSVLGPQLVSDALNQHDKMQPHFLDNTDPAGFDRIFQKLELHLNETLVLVISKSGGTKETRNGMLEIKAFFKENGLNFAKHAVAITGENSILDREAQREEWLARFPHFDWVGGRTSVTSVVGLLPLALQGVNIEEFLEGAALCDQVTRNTETLKNPSALLALMWYFASEGQGKKDMVILPYKDQLQLLSKYLQQLVMESLGKKRDIEGNLVQQGLTVYGNKGSTDQHAYVQQLLDGVDNFFVTFIQVLEDRPRKSIYVEDRVTSGDYLLAFLQGVKEALTLRQRQSITIGLERLNPKSMGVLIALYERAVGFYASLINVNAYHQPAVEACKKVAARTIAIQQRILEFLEENRGRAFTLEEIVEQLKIKDNKELVLTVLEHAALNQDHGLVKIPGENYFASKYYFTE